MSENFSNYRRRPIHGRDAQTPPRENSECEDDEALNESQDKLTTESGSDFEGFDGNSTYSPEIYSQRELSRSVPRTPQRPKRASNPKTKPYSPEPNKTHTLKRLFIYPFAIVVIVSGCAYAFFHQTGSDLGINTQKNCSYEKLQQQYPKEEPWLWRSLRVGIESILNKRIDAPEVYLFVHHGGDHVYQLVKDIAAHSSSCFGQEMRPVEMDSEDFIVSSAHNDYGYTIEKYKMKIKEGNVILIANLNEIPAEAARALHTICDTHSPIAKDVVIFLTLTVPPIVEGNVESNAEDTLIKLWGTTLGDNELEPLITRVTDQVIALQI